MNGDYGNVLHTNSEYVNIPRFKASFERAVAQQDLVTNSINFLKQQEGALYAWVGESTYQGFMAKLRTLFAEHAEDVRIYQDLQKKNLNQLIGINALFSGLRDGVTVHLVCKVPQGFKFDGHFLNFSNPNVELIVKGQLDITFTYNISNIKQILNAIQGSRLHKTSNNEVLVKEALRELMGSGDIGTFTIGSDNGSQVDVLQQWKTDISNAFSYDKRTIDSAINGNNKDIQLITKAIKDVHSFLSGLCNGGSQLLRDSFEQAWVDKIGNRWEHPNADVFANFGFFSKGGNAASGVAGAIQEMAAAMSFIYMQKALGIYSPPLAKILGNLPQQGSKEQPKSDVEILQNIGIQVKAYSQSNLNDLKGNAQMDKGSFINAAQHHRNSTMETNVHPAGLDANLLGHNLGIDNIGDAIVQCCFNSSNGDPNQFEDTIENFLLAQTMNFTTNSNELLTSQIGNTVAFYFLDAQYLVPGSVMLESLHPSTKIQDIPRSEVTITGEIHDWTDESFLEQTLPSTNEKDGVKPLFTDYWNGSDETDYWNATSKNFSDYNRMYTNSVSIRVYFEYAFMENADYSIYHV